MIASLTGKVLALGQGLCVLEVGGIGFQVLIPSTLSQQVSTGDTLSLHTALIVREDAFTLFGFSDVAQLSLFDHLRSVSGVGPKTALAAISTLSPSEIASAVADEDPAAFERVPGIGAKTAKLIVVSLSGKLKGMDSTKTTDSSDLLLAMQSLGWPERLAEPAVRSVLQNRSDKSFAELLRETISILGSKK